MSSQGPDILEQKQQAFAKMQRNPELVLRGPDIERLTLYEFLRVFWSEVAETNFRDNWHVEFLCRELEQVALRVARGLPLERGSRAR